MYDKPKSQSNSLQITEQKLLENN